MDNLKEEETNEINYIIDQLQKLNKKFKIYTVQRFKEEEPFNKYISESVSKKTRLLIHGTRCSSVIPILQTGLKIRPSTSVHFSGKVYGEGNYFSEHVQKSLNYTGWDNDQILLIYEVHVGNEYIYEGWYNGDRGIKLNYNELLQNGYNSTYVKAGNGLQNSEIISYNEDQSKIKYIIHITK
ncbi:100L [Invertebrate iridescent virus Kaz2018]|uniref:Putative poly [ADP-ribose] polymerase-like 100L n=1 Tax=Invertebrate iridescent virus 6 TaxID=176652 RepID=PARP_IIV6|nr:polymerase [Invertebrate iridescent virus 6]O55721.1 RecName: Full=Putative poly [ADP-ribose] polymerase-like 100L [Invertebrate iridescent virus 6]AAB94432.1 100L [Invertebrate iridescent virus 6]QNH08510.1 100L [Invertebrate iridescent virus Kaz2018]